MGNQGIGPLGHSWWCFIDMEPLICGFQTTLKSQWVLCWPSSDAAMWVLGRREGTLRLRHLLSFSGVSWQTRNSPDFWASTLGSSQSSSHPNWFFHSETASPLSGQSGGPLHPPSPVSYESPSLIAPPLCSATQQCWASHSVDTHSSVDTLQRHHLRSFIWF